MVLARLKKQIGVPTRERPLLLHEGIEAGIAKRRAAVVPPEAPVIPEVAMPEAPGPSLQEMIGENLATRKQLELLKKYIEQGTLQEKLITRPIWLSSSQARGLGFDIEEGEFIKLGPEGAAETVEMGTPITISLATPEGISEPVSVGELIERLEVASIIDRVYPDMTAQALGALIEQDPDAFRDDLISKGRTEAVESLLRVLGQTEEDIDLLFTYGDIPDEGQPFVFERDVGGVPVSTEGTLKPGGMVWLENEFVGAVDLNTGILYSIKELKQMALPSDEEMRATLRMGQVPEDEIDKLIAQTKLDLTSEEWLAEFKKINPSFRKNLVYGIASRSFASGLGDVVAAGGGIAGWAKQETMRQNLLEVAEVLQTFSPEMVSWHGPGTVIDPRFWQTTVVSTMTFSVALIAPAILTAYAAVPVAAGIGLGAFGKAVLVVTFGAVGRGLTEAAFESGSVWNEAKALDFTDEEANEAAASVYWKNAATLTAMSVPEFAFAFGVNPFGGALTRLFSKGLVRVGRFGVPALTEGGQEYVQDIYTRQALGQPITWDDEAKLAVVLGAILGIGVGAGGNAFTAIQSRLKARLTPELQEIFDTEKDRLVTEGLSPEGAELRAMDAVAETPEGQSLIEDIVEEFKQAELERVIQPEDRVEALAVEHALEAQKVVPEVPAVEPVVVPEVTPPAVVDVGVLPENPARAGAEIADELAITYNGLQETVPGKPSMMLFTDPQTGSTFAANTLDIARTKLDAMRAKFAEPEVPAPVVEPIPRAEPGVPEVPAVVPRVSRLEGELRDFFKEDAFRVGMIEHAIETGKEIPFVAYDGTLNMAKALEQGVRPEAFDNGVRISIAGKETVIEAEGLIQPIKEQYMGRLEQVGADIRTALHPPKGLAELAPETLQRYKDDFARLVTQAREQGIEFTPDEIATFPEEIQALIKPPAVPEVVEAPPAKPPTVEDKVQKELAIQKSKQDTFVESSEQTDISKAGEDAFNAQSEFAGLPPPNIPPGNTGHIGAGGDNAENSLYDMTNRVIPGEDAGRAALRLWDGTRNRMATETIAWWRKGNKTLKDLGIGTTEGRNQRLTEEDSLELFKALHGEGSVPANLQSFYDDLKVLLDQEASDMLAFDPTFSRVLMAHPDYFPRGWRPPREAQRLKLGAKPGFLKPRVDATFTEMVEAGWEPISWNPYDMLALRRMSGTEYREGRILISRLKTFSKAIAEHDAPREGWRVPKVGPAFEGKPYVSADGKAYMTPKVSVPNRVADVLESIYGVKIEFRVAGVDIWRAISGFGAVTKRAKLFMSLFQHVDFLTRDFIVGFTPEGIRHGLPLKFPALAARVSWSAVSPTFRANLEARILSGEPLYIDSDISLKMVADKGWKLGQDELLIRRDVREQLEAIVKEAQAEGLKVRWFQRAGQAVVKATDPVTRRLDAVAKFFEAGLFDGVYRESQAYVLEHVVIPRLKRLHPEWTSEQIAGSAAEEINKQFSTLAVWQSVLQQPAAREVARTFFFSWNETESWMRQASSAVKGENAVYWREYTIAMYIALAVAANAINMISEGEPLPADRYVPFKLGSPYSSMPWGIAYNDKFMSPRLPWNGRNGQPLYLDIVGQADTWLRWILDPAGALTARVNVLPRAVINQVQGRDFWGRELKDWDDRVKQLVLDLFAPIGAGNLLEIARLQWPEVAEVLPEAEARIGIVGSLIQATGLNVRAIKTRDMLDNFARESGLKKADGTPVETWDDLEPSQRRILERNEVLQRELGLRSVVAVERQYPGAEGFAKLDTLDQERITRGETLVGELVSDLIGIDRTEAFDEAKAFRAEVSRLKKEIADRKSQVDEDYQLFKDTGELPDDPNKRALVEYYNIFEKGRRPSGAMDWDKVRDLELALRTSWTPAEEAYVDRNIGLTEWGPLMQEFIDGQRVLSDSGYWDVPEIDRRVFRFQHPEIEDILTGKFYNYKPIEEEAEKISLEWQDAYRQIDAMREKYKEMSDSEINSLPSLEGISDKDWAAMSPDKKRDTLIEFDRERIYNENPGFWEDDRRRIAWNAVGDLLNEKRSLVFVNEFAEYSNIAREFSPNSSQGKLYRFDSTELDALGTHDEVFNWDQLDESKVPIWRIDVKYEVEDTEYEAIDGEDREGRDAYLAGEGLEGDAFARRVEYRKDRRRRVMLRLDASDTVVEEFVEYGEIIDEFGSNSAQATLFRTKHPDLQDFAEAEGTFGWDDLSDIDIRVVNIDVKWAVQDDEYDAIPGDDREARQTYLAKHEEYRKDRRRRDGYKARGLKDEIFTADQVETYVSYYEHPEKGFRRERMLLEDKAFGEAMHAILGIDIPDRVPAVQYDEIYEQWQADFDKLEDLSDHRSPDYIKDPDERATTREAMRFEDGVLTEFGKAEIRRNAYGAFVPEKHVQNYVDYYTIISEGKPEDWENRAGTALPWWEDDWWMMEHPDFYKQVYRRILGNERKDYRLVPPTRELGAKYLKYLRIVFNQAARDQYRLDNPDLDEWGVSVGIWTRTMSEKRRREGLTSTELFEEEIAERQKETEEALEEIEEKREALVP